MTANMLACTMARTLRDFLETRQALGYGDRGVRSLIFHFDRYLVEHRWRRPLLTREIVEDWAASDGPLQPRSRAQRLHVMRLLGRFISFKHPDTYVPGPAWGPRQKSGFRPHIYSPGEIQMLLAEAARLTPHGSLRPKTYVALFALLSCTGLRISEALALRLVDVDHDAILWVRESKFHKSRAVPLAENAMRALDRYRRKRARYGHDQAPEAPLFVNESGRGCAYPQTCSTFLEVARRCGLRGPAGTKGARLHDLRHSFAVARLLAWYRDGGDVQARLPLLADYLGHVSLVSTQVYLEITPELLVEAAGRFSPPPMRSCPSDGGVT
jgi:integrase/recombinase XerD